MDLDYLEPTGGDDSGFVDVTDIKSGVSQSFLGAYTHLKHLLSGKHPEIVGCALVWTFA